MHLKMVIHLSHSLNCMDVGSVLKSGIIFPCLGTWHKYNIYVPKDQCWSLQKEYKTLALVAQLWEDTI